MSPLVPTQRDCHSGLADGEAAREAAARDAKSSGGGTDGDGAADDASAVSAADDASAVSAMSGSAPAQRERLRPVRDAPDLPPNELLVAVVRAKGLPAMDAGQ